MKQKTSSFALIRRYAARYQRQAALLAATYTGSTLLLVLLPRALARFIDAATSGNMRSGALSAILFYLAVALLQTATAAFLEYQLTALGQKITDDHRMDVMGHYLSLESRTLAGFSSGEAMTRLDEDVQGLFEYYYVVVFKLAGSGVSLACILAVLALRVGWMSLILLAVSLLSILLFKVIQDRGVKKYTRESKANAEFNGAMKELLDNAHILRATGAEAFSGATLRKAMLKRFRESLPASFMYANLWSAMTVVQGLLMGSGLLLAVLLWDAGRITVATAFLIYSYCQLIITPLQDFRNHMGELQRSKAKMIRTQELLELPGMPDSGTRTLGDGPLEVEIDAVSFSYETGVEVLREISLTIPAGKKIGIMGRTGCGKTTLFSLISRLNRLEEGRILLGGVDSREVASGSLRRKVAYCTQHVQLIHGTLRDNITLFSDAYSDREIIAAIEAIGLSEWFRKMRSGLDTRLELGKGSLSAGEAQLLTLVRLSLEKPGLVLLDEITSNLDAETERRVNTAIEALCGDCTVLAIAHSASATDWMDQVLTMEDGRFVAAREGSLQ